MEKLKKKILFILERGEREREGEKHQYMVASLMPPLGTYPATKACALTGNRTGDPLVGRPALNPLIHTSQGWGNFLSLFFQKSFQFPALPLLLLAPLLFRCWNI